MQIPMNKYSKNTELLFKVGPGHLTLCDSTLTCQENGCAGISFNLTTRFERITKHVDASNSIC